MSGEKELKEECDLVIDKLNVSTKGKKDLSKKDYAPKELSNTDLENVSGGISGNSIYIFGEYICPYCGNINKIGFWYMEEGLLKDTTPHINDSCKCGKASVISYHDGEDWVRLETNNLVKYKIVAMRNSKAEWIYYD